MTFIASVIAKKGVALIADSLVTSSKRIIEVEDFEEMLKAKTAKATNGEKISIYSEDIIELFKSKPSHTKNYEEKLFKYDDYTAISTAGSAVIDGKRIGELVAEMVAKNKSAAISYAKKKIETKVKDFRKFILGKVKSHIDANKIIRPTIFIITHYDVKAEKTIIYRLRTAFVSSDMLQKNPKMDLVEMELMGEHNKVVFDGQNRISERLLWGEIEFLFEIVPRFMELVLEEHEDLKDRLTHELSISIIRKLLKESYIREDIKMNKLSDLSIQQAIDLACLLMKIEVDMQNFTENIQTVGGLIKVAVITEEGFRFIAGHELYIPSNL